MKVKLTYYRVSGKYYADGEYNTMRTLLYRIWEEVADMMESATLPGMQPGHSDYIVSIDVPDHPHRHPHLLLPQSVREALRTL